MRKGDSDSSRKAINGLHSRTKPFFFGVLVALSCTVPICSEGLMANGSTPPNASVVQVELPDRRQTEVEELAAKVDASLDQDWETEALNDLAESQIKKLAGLIEQAKAIAPSAAEALVTPDFACGRLRPGDLQLVADDGALLVRRARLSPSDLQSDTGTGYQGPRGFVDAIRELVSGFNEDESVQAHLKLFQIDTGRDSFNTRLHFEAVGRGPNRSMQLNATWRIVWSNPQKGSSMPQLKWIGIEHYEEVEIHIDGGALFSDCTKSVIAGDASYEQQVLPGINHWLPRISSAVGMSMFAQNGIAIGDINDDGLEDLYVCDAGGLPNRLYLQRPDGTVRDVAAAAGVDWLDRTHSALIIDVDNDRDQDLVVVGLNTLLIHENKGQGQFGVRFADYVTAGAVSVSAADYDHDGDLDLYICGNTDDKTGTEIAAPVPYYDANNGSANVLLRNDGNFRFVDVTGAVGLDQNNRRFSFAAAWDDYDNDGDLDLYVANDFGLNNLYRNDGGHFVDVAGETGVEDTASGMSVAWGDYNRDGRMDVYVGNMFSAAGTRVTFQPQYMQGASASTASRVQRMARGNTLFVNRGDEGFTDISETAAVTMGRWSWGSKFADLNNDGWLDLVVTNGYVSNEDTGDL